MTHQDAHLYRMTVQDAYILSYKKQIAECGVRKGRQLQAQACAQMVRGGFRRIMALIHYLGRGASLERRLP